jgi:transposase
MSRPPGRKTLGDWIGAHTRALAAIGGVPRLIVPDNAKVAVIKACLYEPQVNRSYAEMAAHYGTAILPTRPHGRGRGSHHRTMDLGHGCDIGASTASPI